MTERREVCTNCVRDIVNNMQGAASVKNKIFYIVMGLVLTGNLLSFGLSRAESNQIAVNAEAIKQLQALAEQNTIDHKEMAQVANESLEAQTKVLLDAIAAANK